MVAASLSAKSERVSTAEGEVALSGTDVVPQSLPGMSTHASQGRAPRIALLGLFGCVNFGNDGQLASAKAVLRNMWPDAELACICVNPEKVEQEQGIRGIWINWSGYEGQFFEKIDRYCFKSLRRALNIIRTFKTVRQFDAIVVPGTGALCDYRVDPFGAVYWIFRWCLAARACGVKICLVNVSAGPIERPLSRWMLTQVARFASYRSYRDLYSSRFVAELGVDTSRDNIYPDIVFRLPCPETEARILAPGQPSAVGVGLMWYNGWQGHRNPRQDIYENYLTQMSGFVCWLLEHGHPVRLLIGESTDEAIVDLIKERVENYTALHPLQAALTAEPIHSLHTLMLEIAQTDIVVASRYHNLICAMKMGRPTISVGYAARHEDLMEGAGMRQFCQHIDTVKLERLIEDFTEIDNSRAIYTQRLADRMAEFQHNMERQDPLLAQAIMPMAAT